MMGYLLYCIFRSLGYEEPKQLSGVGGKPVFSLSYNGLTAAVSENGHTNPNPEISSILAHKKIVDSFNEKNTVIPMRYGCLFHEKSQILQALETQDKQYDALLKELDGCVEMGLRVLVPDVGSEASNGIITPVQNKKVYAGTLDQKTVAESPGQAFLAARKAHYTKQNMLSTEFEKISERCRKTFAGIFRNCKTEKNNGLFPEPLNQHVLLSIYFLVPKKSIKAFQTAFQNLSCLTPYKLLMSGPWPPYNFV